MTYEYIYKIVVFAVGGLIEITARLVVQKNITILGQTAPGEGISVYGNGVSYSNANNTITRYIRYRMGKGGDSGKDATGIAEGNNMIFDHLSTSWGRDETFSINGPVVNVTIQDSIISQGLETHSCGGLVQTDGGVSIFRTLYIDNKTRNPKVKGKNDFTNNVVYNWGGGGGYIAGDSAGQSYANILNNVFISGPNTSVPAFTRGNLNFHAYVKDNYVDSDLDGTLNGSILDETTDSYSVIDFQTEPFDYPSVGNLMAPEEALQYVMTHAGASLVRDRVDDYLINTELASLGTAGALIDDEADIGGPGPIDGGSSLLDTDGDGIPDDWEAANGLDPNDREDAAAIAENGYANIENYANWLLAEASGDRASRSRNF
ncbi:polysaccharide lyase family 1 protein [Flagelloscypha sp. PMI_526]|nr:polysaccharide lyase family 1 protein [Flagelloscypha sp. PMI_526]